MPDSIASLLSAYRRSRTRRSRSRALFSAALWLSLGLGLGSGCSEETGLIIDIAKGSLDRSPDTLELYIGVEDALSVSTVRIPGCLAGAEAARFVTGESADERLVDVAGRDLSSDPYKLLLRPGGKLGADDRLMVVAVARSGQDAIGVGALSTAVGFADGQVQRWPLSLEPLPATFGMANDCLCAQTEGLGEVVITPNDNLDCDVAAASVDCDDTDPRIYEGAPELCDGFDNNCVEGDERFPTTSLCLARGIDSCFIGARTCDDTTGDPATALGDCVPAPIDTNVASETMCQAFDDCAPVAGQFLCAIDHVFTNIQCTARVGPNGLCDGSSVAVGDVNSTGDSCQWTLIGGMQQDMSVVSFISLENGVEYTPVANICAPLFAINEIDSQIGTEGVNYLIWESIGGVPERHLLLHVDVELVDDCLDPSVTRGLSCEGLPDGAF